MNWEWKILNAGGFRLDGGSMFGVIPKAMWSKLVKPDESNRLPYSCNCLLLEKGGQRILVECGFGTGWTAKEKDIFGMNDRNIDTALKEEGIDPNSIETVILSHLHFDHAAGISLLPNATVVIQEQEWEDANNNRSTMSKTYLPRVLDDIRNRISLTGGQTEVADGIRVTPRIGHTWGLQSIEIKTDDGTLCFISDVMPTHNHIGLAFSMGYDMLPWDNKKTKQDVLQEGFDNNWIFALYHDIEMPIAVIKKDEQGSFYLDPFIKSENQ